MAIAAGQFNGLALTSDGSLVGWGDNSLGQATVPVGNGFVSVAAGVLHGLAIQHQVPEPTTFALLALGLPLLIERTSRRSRACSMAADSLLQRPARIRCARVRG